MKAFNALMRGSAVSRIGAVLLLCAVGTATAVLAASRKQNTPPQPEPRISLGAVDYVAVLRNPADVKGRSSGVRRLLKRIVGLDDSTLSMVQPHGVAVDTMGRVVVADTKGRVVHIFDAVNHKYQAVRPPASDPFVSPIAVALDAGNRIYVTDSVRARIFLFRADGKFLLTLGAINKSESIFKRCTGLAIDRERGRLYAVDTVAMQIVVMSLEGRVLSRIGRPGDGPAEFNYPTHIAVAPDGTLWVVDSLNSRVQHLDGNGKFLLAFGRNGDAVGDFDKPKGISLDGEGRIYVVEGRSDRVQVYDDQGRMLFSFGHTGSGPGEFFLPAGIALGRENDIYVADGHNGRVEVFRPHVEGDALSSGGGK